MAGMYMPSALQQAPHIYGVFTDFTEDQTDLFWIDTVTDSGTVAMGDAVGGTAVFTPSDCSIADNDEAYIRCANEIFKVASQKPLYGECRLQFAETVASTQNIAFMFQNAIGADSIIDTAGGLKVSGDTLGIYKAETGFWKCVSVVAGGTATVSTSTTPASAATWYVLGIEVIHQDSLGAIVAFKVDGASLYDSNGNVIVHRIAYASATEMNVGCGVKLGAGTNNDTMTVDYIGGWQAR